ncbi:MAG: heavy metal translocating P-type ATPase [Synechococcales cyanobacterium M58_A2018_015]|nr:heavy metal translocating P-type ATPase [Synechococcales cyanobacterium M58_A2018_015]
MASLPCPRLPLRYPSEGKAAVLCALLVGCGWLLLHIGWIGLALLILAAAYAIGGYESAKEGLTTLIQEKELDVDLLMIVAALGAAGLGLWQQDYYLLIDGAILILIFALSGALESYAMQRTERSIRSLMSLTSDTARLLHAGTETLVPIRSLQVGDQIRVKPGELIPTDGRIVEGTTTLNEAAITGESLPVEKTLGDLVYAGTLNGAGALTLQLDQPPESSLLQRVIRLVEQAQTEKPPSQQFIEQFERLYARGIVLIGALLLLLPPLLWDWDWSTTIYRALIFLVVASPCALMTAIMPTLLSGIANGARQGILFKNGAQLETIGQVKAIAFDKTGTLTYGKLQVVQVLPESTEGADGSDAAANGAVTKLLQVAAALESRSEHPIATTIVNYVSQQALTWPDARDVQAHIGVGITGWIQHQQAVLGKADFVQAQTNTPPAACARLLVATRELEQSGKTVIWVAYAQRLLGLIAVADTIRPSAAATVARLKQLGIQHIVLLTGDNERTATHIGERLGIDCVYANLLPEDKVNCIKQLQQQYGTVAMVGDGINDAPALAQAAVGIAMGVAGSDVALETADIVLMSDQLEKLETAVRLGRRSQRIIRQNIVFALSFIGILLLANFTRQISLPLGVIGHEGSTVLVTLSGLRLLR